MIRRDGVSRWTFTSESVTEGHPDKMADQISDAILDACLKVDKDAKCAVETAAKANMVSIENLTIQIVLLGEVSLPNSNGQEVFYEQIARKVCQQVGFTSKEMGIDCYDCNVITSICE